MLRRKKRCLCLSLALCIGLFWLVLILGGCEQTAAPQRPVSVRVGITLYDGFDTFILELNDYASARARELEQETGVPITLIVEAADGGGRKEIQNGHVEAFIESGCDVICVNLVDRMDAATVIDKAEAAGIPIVFFNRELVEEDLNRNENLYYVGAEALESGRMQGEIVADAWRKNQERLDKNGDGILQYVMLEGETGHQDAVVRTESSVQAIANAGVSGIQVERLESDTADWMRSRAESKMKQWLDVHGDKIEAVLANNDDMALGAIDALKRAEIPSQEWPVVVGIDGTAPGRNAVLTGEMLGTVYNDARGQGEAMIDLAFALATEGEMPEALKGKYIRLPYREVTIDNVLRIGEMAEGGERDD